MNYQAIEQTLLTAMLVTPALAVLYKDRLFSRIPRPLLFILCCVVAYGLFLARAHFISIRLEQELYAFDLDGDRAFTGAELTVAQSHAMDRWTGDTARSLAPYSGLIISPLFVAFAYGIVFAVRRTRHYFHRLFTIAGT